MSVVFGSPYILKCRNRWFVCGGVPRLDGIVLAAFFGRLEVWVAVDFLEVFKGLGRICILRCLQVRTGFSEVPEVLRFPSTVCRRDRCCRSCSSFTFDVAFDSGCHCFTRSSGTMSTVVAGTVGFPFMIGLHCIVVDGKSFVPQGMSLTVFGCATWFV